METATDARPVEIKRADQPENPEEIFYDAPDGGICSCSSKKSGDHIDAGENAYEKIKELIANIPIQDTHYKMDHQKRGVAYIFNHEIFEDSGLQRRLGTNEDCKDLNECLSKLGFEVHIFQDLNFTDMGQQIRNAAQMDHTHHDCLVMAVMSHGGVDKIYAKDFPYRPHYLWSNFTADKCPTLAGKPKLFILQACQGEDSDEGITLRMSQTDAEIHETFRIPANVQTDFLIVYSTVRGNVSWRNSTEGSWFIQSLCQELKERAYDHDLLTILTFVSQRVAIDYESYVPGREDMHRRKQIPCVLSRLTKLILFKSKV